MIDGYDAASVPDGITAERLDSAGYSLGLSMDTKSVRALEETAGITVAASKTACTDSTAYKQVLAAKRVQSRMGVPNDGKRWLLASPEFMEVLLTDDRFVKQGDLSQELVQSGVVGRIAGYNVFESNNTMFEDSKLVSGKKTTTEFICGHPELVHRVQEWSVPVAVKNLTNEYIGSSAVQAERSTASVFPSRRRSMSREWRRKAWHMLIFHTTRIFILAVDPGSDRIRSGGRTGKRVSGHGDIRAAAGRRSCSVGRPHPEMLLCTGGGDRHLSGIRHRRCRGQRSENGGDHRSVQCQLRYPRQKASPPF